MFSELSPRKKSKELKSAKLVRKKIASSKGTAGKAAQKTREKAYKKSNKK